jgi:hypothetical protein
MGAGLASLLQGVTFMSAPFPVPRDPLESDHPLARGFASFTEAAGSLESTYGQLQAQAGLHRETGDHGGTRTAEDPPKNFLMRNGCGKAAARLAVPVTTGIGATIP